MPKRLNFIDGEWVGATSGRTFQNVNPADTREVVAEYPLSDQAEAIAAIQAAARAFPGWRGTTAVARGRILSKASQLLEARKGELSEALTREEGKTLAESTGEVQRAIDIFRFFGGLSYTLGGQTIPHDLPNNLLYTARQPLGVVALITPWNFPIAIPAWKLAPALVAGNSVVLKPASQAPGMAAVAGDCRQLAGATTRRGRDAPRRPWPAVRRARPSRIRRGARRDPESGGGRRVRRLAGVARPARRRSARCR